MGKKIIFFLLSCIVVGALSVGTGLYWLVAISPGEAVSRKNIDQILAIESPVYYSDGQTRMGVFFQETHRQYVPFEKIPKDFVNAIVAAEDQDFFQHYGVDFQGILRAVVANIKAGRVVQGGSTITQQTAKNLFKRKDRSLTSKLRELLFALRLEYHYTKEEILEFYINQFYVSGNGRGLGVAARYYFDKPASDLDLLECAFIAGSVKRPNYYNPFIKKTEADVQKARERSKERAAYVLGNMYRQGAVYSERYQEHIQREVPFRQGQMYYALNTVMDLVKAGLESPVIVKELAEHGIDNISTSGIRVITTIEKELQESAVHGLRKELSQLDVRLTGYDPASLQEEYGVLLAKNVTPLQKGEFAVGRIVAVDRETPQVSISFDGRSGNEEDAPGIIDRKGLLNLLRPLVKHRKFRWSEVSPQDMPLLLDLLPEGGLVYVYIREVDSLTGAYLLDLEKYPELQGGTLAMKDGTIRAMAGGFENHFFNRAIHAKRSMGSAIKPLVYAAALQLGWNSLDALDNTRNVFVFQKQAYFPRPDHKSPHRQVSMNWAGVHSENLATIWLLYHMLDKLTPAQFKEVVDHLGLGRTDDESYQQYMEKVRDRYGIVVDRESVEMAAFDRAVSLLRPDLLFGGDMREYDFLGRLHYGAGFDGFLGEIDLALEEEVTPGEELAGEQENKSASEEREEKRKREEYELRRSLLKKNFLRYMKLKDEMISLSERVERGEAIVEPPAPDIPAYGDVETDNVFEVALFQDTAAGVYIFGEVEDYAGRGFGMHRVDPRRLMDELAEMSSDERRFFWDAVLIDGNISSSTLGQLNTLMKKEYDRLSSYRPYSYDLLFELRDFKVFAGLQYLIRFCRALGIESALEPVLSFPLGSNVISVYELVRAYEGLSGGYSLGGTAPELSVIDRILDSDGEVIYAAEKMAVPVVDPRVSLCVRDILRNVVRFGTGRYADRNIRLQSRDAGVERNLRSLNLRVPVMGKTGTANRFTNAVFAGVVPAVDENGTLSDNGYVLAAYVGYDDNKPMEWNTTHVSGAVGALPMWTALANAIFLEKDYAARLDLADLYFAGFSEIPSRQPQHGQTSVAVDPARGGLPPQFFEKGSGSAGRDTTVITFGQSREDGALELQGFFLPYWKTEEN